MVEIRSDSGTSLEEAIPNGCQAERVGHSLYCYTRNAAELLNGLKKLPGVTFLHRPTGLEDVFLRLTGRELRDL